MTKKDYRKDLDRALKMNSGLEATLGIDSTKSQRDAVKSMQYKNLEFLKKIDPERFEMITEGFKASSK